MAAGEGSGSWLAVDFGTSYSSAARWADGRAVAVKDPVTKDYSMPSSLLLATKGELVVGTRAEHGKGRRPMYYVDEVKRRLGQAGPEVLGEKDDFHYFEREQLVAEVIGYLRREAEKAGEPFERGVITVPAAYHEHKRDAMLRAAKLAGFEEVELLDEPVAAALSRRAPEQGDELVLVYDLGGGTFDVALVELKGEEHRVVDFGGDENLGGIDFDGKIENELAASIGEPLTTALEGLRAESGSPEFAAAKRLELSAHDICERMKRYLSTDEHADDALFIDGIPYSFELSRERLAELVDRHLARTVRLCDELVRGSGREWGDVDALVMVGGSCHLPFIGERLRREFHRPVEQVEEPELAVCLGAAVWQHRREERITRAHAVPRAGGSRERWLAVDVGASATKAAVWSDGGPVAIREPLLGGFAWPTSVLAAADGVLSFGEMAERGKVAHPYGYLDRIKSLLGRHEPVALDSAPDLLPEDLLEMLIHWVRREAAQQHGAADGLVLTVPAAYTGPKGELMASAGRAAGFDKVNLFEEPAAAAFARPVPDKGEELLLVYDLGGGTFDAALVRLAGDQHQVLGFDGLGDVGGSHFDRAVEHDLVAQAGDELAKVLQGLGAEPGSRENLAAKRTELAARDFCEQIKHDLSSSEEADGTLPLPDGRAIDYSLSRNRLAKLIEPDIELTVSCCDQLVTRGGLTWDDVDEVLLVGGSTRLPFIPERLEYEFGRRFFNSPDPGLAICLGAATWAHRRPEALRGSAMVRGGM